MIRRRPPSAARDQLPHVPCDVRTAVITRSQKKSLPSRKPFLLNCCWAGTICSGFPCRTRAAASLNVRSPDSFLVPKGTAERPPFRISCTKSAPRKREAPVSSASMGRRYVKRIIAAAQPVNHLGASGSKITPTHERRSDRWRACPLDRARHRLMSNAQVSKSLMTFVDFESSNQARPRNPSPIVDRDGNRTGQKV
jgi:hypothetical protein